MGDVCDRLKGYTIINEEVAEILMLINNIFFNKAQIPVPTLKEKLIDVAGVPVERQRLIFRGKEDCELVKIDIHCRIQGDAVLECITLDEDLEREQMMFRVMFNTAFIRSNILILNRDEIDILWNAKDRFPKDFRAEVLLSEMDAAASLVTVELASGEEKEGFPVEAFAKVQEVFNNIDWVDGKGDTTLHVLKKLTSSNVFLEKLDSVSLQKVKIDLPRKSSPESLEILKEIVKLDEVVDRITTSSPADPKQQHEPFQKSSPESLRPIIKIFERLREGWMGGCQMK